MKNDVLKKIAELAKHSGTTHEGNHAKRIFEKLSNKITKCLKCGISLKVAEKKEHFESCPNQLVSCPYKENGCDALIFRSCLKSHLLTKGFKHAEMVKEYYNTCKKEHIKFGTKYNELVDEYSKLSTKYNELVDEYNKRQKECMTGKYAVLMETSGEEQESWYYFIKVEGNEENLKHLSEQLESVEWYLLDDLSEFQLDMEYFVSAQTAKEMTKIDLNYVSFHHKFDGVLQKIDLGFRKKDGNSTKISKTFDVLGFGQIENFIDDEDLDEEDLVTDFEDDDDTDNAYY